MNNRHRELALEASKWCSENAVGTPVAWEWEDKFAELLIKECISKAEQEEDRFIEINDIDLAYCMQNFQYLLKDHFGIDV